MKKKKLTLEELKNIATQSSSQLKLSELVQLVTCESKREFNKLFKSFLNKTT